jgi:hypothetical protein
MIEVPENLTLVRIPDIQNINLYGAYMKIVGWGRSRQVRTNPILKVGPVVVLSHHECLDRISNILNDQLYFDNRHALCTAADPFVILRDVSIFEFQKI